MLPPSSGSKKQSKKTESKQVLAACFYVGFFFNPEDGGDVFLRNIG
jgi:hypothetical protein